MSAGHSSFEIVRTREGAAAMLDRTTGEVMHPIGGPLPEAQQLYIGPSQLQARLLDTHAEPLVLLDVGLGAGSNAAAAWRVSEGLPPGARQLQLVSFDRTLEAMALALSPPYAEAFGFDAAAGEAGRSILDRHMHQTPRTQWRLRLGELRESLARERAQSADIVFWDPFSPRADPALWSVAAFHAVFRLCRVGATLHTYSAATATRSALLLAGFAVGLGEGAAGRQPQTTVAAMHPEQLERPLDRRWLQRLARSSAAFAADAPKDALARIGRLAQFV